MNANARPKIVSASLATLALLLLAVSPAPTEGADPPPPATFNEHVAAVFFDRCVACHRPDTGAPMSLLTYESARPWAKSILRQVSSGDMPPWHADTRWGTFRNDRGLSPEQRDLITRWVEAGAPEGPGSPPPSPTFETGWRYGEPDLVVTLEAVEVEAGDQDLIRNLRHDFDFEDDVWVRALEVRPGATEVVHHAMLYTDDGSGPPDSGWIGVWGIGLEPMSFPDGTGKVLRKDHPLIVEMHYSPSEVDVVDQTQIGLYFHDAPPERELINLWVLETEFVIPANAKNYQLTAQHTFDRDSTLRGAIPHMHYRGTDFTITAKYPDGGSAILLRVGDYDFDWQTNYEFEPPVSLPAGTTIVTSGHYDNTAGNPRNPDPNKDITPGWQSYQEMFVAFIDYTVD